MLSSARKAFSSPPFKLGTSAWLVSDVSLGSGRDGSKIDGKQKNRFSHIPM